VPKELFQTIGSLAQSGKGRRIELTVSDGEFTTDSVSGALTSAPRTAVAVDGGVIEDDTYLDSYTWTVDTVREICQ
jgi:hypothetical protein